MIWVPPTSVSSSWRKRSQARKRKKRRRFLPCPLSLGGRGTFPASLKKERFEQWRVEAYQDKLEGKITKERWLALERRWSKQLLAIDAELESLEDSTGPRLDDAEAAFKLLQRASELYRKQSHEERARLVKALVSNCKMVDGKVEPVYKKPFSLVAEGLKTADWLPGEDSNLQPAG